MKMAKMSSALNETILTDIPNPSLVSAARPKVACGARQYREFATPGQVLRRDNFAESDPADLLLLRSAG
jgi:hypothetical protein